MLCGGKLMSPGSTPPAREDLLIETQKKVKPNRLTSICLLLNLSSSMYFLVNIPCETTNAVIESCLKVGLHWTVANRLLHPLIARCPGNFYWLKLMWTLRLWIWMNHHSITWNKDDFLAVWGQLPNPSHNSSHVATWESFSHLEWLSGGAQEVFGYVAHWCSMWKNGNCLQTKPWAFLMINMRPATMEVKSAWWLQLIKGETSGFHALYTMKSKLASFCPPKVQVKKEKTHHVFCASHQSHPKSFHCELWPFAYSYKSIWTHIII